MIVRRMMVVTVDRPLTTALLFCLQFWCSSTSGPNIAVLVRSPVATSSEPTIIRVYRDDAGRSVVFDKAVLEGGSISNQFLQFRGNSLRIPDNAMSDSDSEPATLTLPVTMTTAQRHGIYSITVTEDDGEETILRVLITNVDASITATEYSTIVSKGDQVTLMVVLTSGVETDRLRWRRDGRFEQLPSTEYSVAMAESSSVLECFVAGDYTQNLHAVMNLITRDCPHNTAGLDCELPCPRCFNGGVCSDKTASCLCPPGFSGVYCERVHGRNIFGQYAEYKCTDTADDHDDGCQGAIICYPEPLGCICPAGYMGIDCMTECVEGKFGANCKQDCHCPDNVVCAKDTGVCENGVCAEGWKGVNCQISAEEACPVGLYGNECTLQCSCPAGPCPDVQSNCDMGCASPWTGEMCSEDSGKGTITMPDYVKVNPDVSTPVTCSAVRNPVLGEEDLQLLGVEGTFVSSSVSEAGDKTYIRTNTWMVTLQPDTVLMASCSIRRTSIISQPIPLMPYERLRYSDSLSMPVLSFTSVTSSSILVSWQQWQDGRDVGDGPIKEYVIQYGEEGDAFMEAARTTSTEHHFMRLNVDTLYRFRVVLVREGPNGDGPPSDVQSQRTLCGDFALSPNLVLVSRNSRTATFRTVIPPRNSWSCSSITVSLQRQQPDGQWIEEQTLSSSSEIVVVRNLIPCSSYSFRVQIDNSQASAESQPVDVTTQPEALVIRIISVISITIGQLDVSWSPPDTSQTNCVLSTYTVMYRLVRHLACTSDVTESMYNSSTTSSTSRTLRGLSNYAEYEVKVRADGEVEGIEIIEIGTTLPAAPSAAPANIMLANISSTCLTFTWKPPPCDQHNGEIMAYQHLLSLRNDTVVTNSSTADVGIELCGLIPYFEYYFKVRAVTSVGQGPCSEIVTTRTEEDVPPQLNPPRFLFTNASSLQLQWQTPYPPHGIITGYNISVQLIDDNQSNMSFIVSVDAENAGEPPSFILTDLEPFRNYSIMVRANTRIGPGNWSLAVISKTNEVPSPPRNIKVSNKTKFSLTIEWDIPEEPAGDIIRYEICHQALEKPYNPDFRVMPCGPHTRILNPNTHIVHHVTSLEPSTVYHIEVSAYISAGQGKISNITERTEIADEFKAVQEGDISQITREGVLATLSLPPLTEMYATHYFIRVRNPQVQRRSVGGIGSFDDNPNDYITAEIEKGDEGEPFTIGDGQIYGMYRNVPLEEDKEYEIYLGTGSRVGEDTEVVWSEPFPLMNPTAFAWIYIVIAVVISVLIVLFIGICLIKRKNISKDKKATKADGGEDAEYVNAAMADDPKDYMPLEEQSRTVSSARYEDLNLKPQGGASTPAQYEVTIVPEPQKPVATPRYQTRNMKGVSSGVYEDVGSENVPQSHPSGAEDEGSENRQLPDVPQSHPSGAGDEGNSVYEVPDRLEEYTGVYINIKAKPAQPGPIKVSEFQNFMTRKKEDVVNDIVQQFMSLPSGRQYPWSVAMKFHNKPRNFFKTILAYDHSRVKLDTGGSDARSDYINASYIKNQQGKTSFIAAQGPQEGTVDDFWKMVWQENVEVIVMVTDNIEKNKLLCFTYWPKKVHMSELFDDITVLLMESTSYTSHTIRKLNLLKGHHKTVHTVTQIQVHSWPYGGIPKESTSLISIIKKVKSLQTDRSSSPLLVHCSNGVGATGTFIAVYVLMDTIKKNKEVNVFDFVKRMRDDRVDMVQTRVQYLFVFEFLLAVLQSTDSHISCDQLKKLSHAAIKFKSKKEYKVLQDCVTAEQHFEDYIGNSPENQHKNRFKNLIPVDKFRPVLKSQGSTFGSNSYINALHLTDFSGREFIITQTPLSSTVEDFWRLVYDYECTTIVMLNTVDGSDETVVQYWPSGGGAQYGLMKVVCTDTANRDSCIESQFQVTHKKDGKKSVSVDHFAFCGWSGNQRDVSKLRQFIRMTGNKSTRPVLVHCINGVGLSAVYVIVKIESERLEEEGFTDVFQCLTKLRKICPHAIQTQEEYTLCYQLLKDHLDNPEEYAVVY